MPKPIAYAALVQKIHFEVALRHTLNPPISMGRIPAGESDIVFEHAVFKGMMVFLTAVTNQDPLFRLLDHAETRRIPDSIGRTPRATMRVTEIAVVTKLLIPRRFSVVAGSGAIAFPAGSERKPCRMDP
ncbi:MAG: hypothetical protein JO249_10375 [Acidobacteria bacterium]|nr:hypothetical protein [Acidobacteriota bacterium]